jgi:D-3-phosphoglycerate dehydrogenase
MKVLVSTAPFSDPDRRPRERLEEAGLTYALNPKNRKLTERELKSLLVDTDVLIAGTEKITRDVLDSAPRLKLICRVGIGLDSVDLEAAREKGIQVTYTPEAPSAAVSELTIGLMINLMRSIHISNDELRRGSWKRYFGNRLEESIIGIIGAGRIGKRVIQHLMGFNCRRILVNDLTKDEKLSRCESVEYVDKSSIYQTADIISLHLPLSPKTKNLIGRQELEMMKSSSFMINTSRGGIVDEDQLVRVLKEQKLAGAAIDTFEKEPYEGPLSSLANCLVTAHMGSMSYDCRARMELEAVDEAVRFVNGLMPAQPVPEEEYENQSIQVNN